MKERTTLRGGSLFFLGIMAVMRSPFGNDDEVLTEVERTLKGSQTGTNRLPSSAGPALEDARIQHLVVPDEQRGRMPFTKDAFLIRENPRKVTWEREVRKFLRRLSPDHGHRISAVMIYEWATTINIAQLVAEGGSANSDLRILNSLLREYFGKSYSTWIAGRKVPNCYRVPPGHRIVRRRPKTLTLYAEFSAGTLYP